MRDEDRPVRPDGLTVRRMRHERGWSPRDLIDAIAAATLESTGIRQTLTPSELTGIEEHAEDVPYATLCLLASGFDCDPVDLWSEHTPDEDEDEESDERGEADDDTRPGDRKRPARGGTRWTI